MRWATLGQRPSQLSHPSNTSTISPISQSRLLTWVAKRAALPGQPNLASEDISTSFAERQNLNVRMHTRRFTRLTNAFSKKVENHAHSVALFAMYYNFVRIHKTLRTTPAMARDRVRAPTRSCPLPHYRRSQWRQVAPEWQLGLASRADLSTSKFVRSHASSVRGNEACSLGQIKR
jgi:hypothetical protein